jgi:hypothetical protein
MLRHKKWQGTGVVWALPLIIGVLVLCACASQQQPSTIPYPNVQAWAGPNKPREYGEYDERFCMNAYDNSNYNENVYVQCMSERGNIVLKDGYFYAYGTPPRLAEYCGPAPPPCFSRSTGWLVLTTPPEVAHNPLPVPEPVPEENQASVFSPPETATSSPPAASLPEVQNNNLAPALARFKNILDEHPSWILKAAHFAGIYDSDSVHMTSSDGTHAILIQDIDWHGALSGTPYRTTFRFSVTCENPEVIDNVNIEVADTNNPPPAFLGTTVIKNAIVLALIEEITIIRGAAIAANAARAINVSISVKDMLSYALKYVASK